MVQLAENWISVNDFNFKLTQNIQWHIQGLDSLDLHKSYFIISNHQSWMDIVIVQKIFNKKIPFIRFFIKQELIFVPFLGWVWWALNFPFMKRYSKKYLLLHPEKRNDDLVSTRKACAVFKGQNVSILNFLEGTRNTPEKHTASNSPYKNLLPPKAGGLAYTLNAMGEQFDSILDVTIFYPQKPVTLIEVLQGKLSALEIHVKKIKIPQEFLKGNYVNDHQYRDSLQNWVHNLWQKKDDELQALKTR